MYEGESLKHEYAETVRLERGSHTDVLSQVCCMVHKRMWQIGASVLGGH